MGRPVGYPVIRIRPEQHGRYAQRHARHTVDRFKTMCGKDLFDERFVVRTPLVTREHQRRLNPVCLQCYALAPKSSGGGNKPIFTGEDMAKMASLYRAGLSIREICQVMLCERSTVKRYLLIAGVKLRPRGGSKPMRGVSHQQMEMIRFMYEYERRSTAEIGRILGLGQTVVLHRMQRAGIPRRPKGEATRLGLQRRREGLAA